MSDIEPKEEMIYSASRDNAPYSFRATCLYEEKEATNTKISHTRDT
jgi:hypothetical protein